MTASARLYLLLFIVVLLFPALGPARRSPPSAQAAEADPSSPILKVTTRLVEVDVVVHDRHGHPIAGLAQSDFVVTDQGRPQKISVFRMNSVDAPAERASAPPVMAANEFSNRVDRQIASPTSVTVILLDFLNTRIQNQARARSQVLKFLRQIQPRDRVALYSLSGRGVRVIHDFTNNSMVLVAALAKANPEISRQLTDAEMNAVNSDTGDDVVDTIIDAENARVTAFFTRNRILDTCQTLTALAQHLQGISGRKNLVWVSAGFPISIGFGDPTVTNFLHNPNTEMFADAIAATSRAMNNANVAVYPVDARGLFGLPMYDASKRSSQIMQRNGRLRPGVDQIDQRNFATMDYLADLTGGRAFYNTNDIGGAIRGAIDDSNVTYTLGYYTSDRDWDNRFHKIKVKVRRGGVSIRAKKGYYASAQAQPSARQLTETEREAIWSPLDATGIGVSARIDPSPSRPFASRISLHINPADLSFNDNNGRFAGAIDVIFAQLTKKNRRIANQLQTVTMNLEPARYQELLRTGLNANRDLPLNADTESVRIVVLDRTTGSVGALTIPITPQEHSAAAATR